MSEPTATGVCGAFAELRTDEGGYLPIPCDRTPGHVGDHGRVVAVISDNGTQGHAFEVEWPSGSSGGSDD